MYGKKEYSTLLINIISDLKAEKHIPVITTQRSDFFSKTSSQSRQIQLLKRINLLKDTIRPTNNGKLLKVLHQNSNGLKKEWYVMQPFT